MLHFNRSDRSLRTRSPGELFHFAKYHSYHSVRLTLCCPRQPQRQLLQRTRGWEEMDGMRELAIDYCAIGDLIHRSRNAETNAEVALIARLAQVIQPAADLSLGV